MQNVIVFTYLQRHLKKMIPIITQLQNRNDINLTVILMTQEERLIAENHSIPFKMLDEFTDNKRNYDFDLGWGLEPLLNAIDRIQPDLFIAIEVNYILRNAIRYCKQQYIPNLIIQHGTPNKFSMHAFTPFEGDIFLAWGDFTRDFLIKNHVASEKIIVTGGATFDRSISLKPDRMAIARELNILPDSKWILFTTQGVGAHNCPSQEEIKVAVQETAKEVLKYPDAQLIFQVHPSQPVEDIAELLNEVQPNNAIVTRYHDTEELMAASYGVITFFSTTAIDAVILQKPLLQITLTDDKDFLPFVEMGAAYSAVTAEEIPVMFQKLLFDQGALREKQKAAAEYVNYKNDGQAMHRIMDIIYDRLELRK